MSKYINQMWIPTSSVDVESILNVINWEYMIHSEASLPDEIIRSISTIGFILDNTQFRNDHMIHSTEAVRIFIKCKFIALFWLLGRYLRKLADDKTIMLDPDGSFRIYLTGCASNGIYGFCAIDEPKFFEKCEAAVARGFLGDNTTASRSEFQIHATGAPRSRGSGISSIDMKAAVSTGLVLLEPGPDNVFVHNDNFLLGAQKEGIVSKPIDFDDVKDCFCDLLSTIKTWKPDTYSLETMPDRDLVTKYLSEVNPETGNTYLSYFQKKIGESVITNDFVALYILEVLLDQRKPVFPVEEEESIEKELKGSFSYRIRLADTDLAEPQSVELYFSFGLSYEVAYPKKFSYVHNGKTLTVDQLGELEQIYLNSFYVAFKDLIDTYPGGITFEQLQNNSLDLRSMLMTMLSASDLNGKGFLTKEIKLDYEPISWEDEERIRISKGRFVGKLLQAVYAKAKAECVSQGVREREKHKMILLKYSLYDKAHPEKRTEPMPAEYAVTVKYVIDDTDYFYAYRKINIFDAKQMRDAEEDFGTAVETAIADLVQKKWPKGIPASQFEVIYTKTSPDEKNPLMRQARAQGIIPDAAAVQRVMRREGLLAGFKLVAVECEPVIRLSVPMAKWFRDYERQRILAAADQLTQADATEKQIEQAIALLQKFSRYFEFTEKINAYTARLQTVRTINLRYKETVAMGDASNKIKVLVDVIQKLQQLSRFRDVEQDIRKFREKLIILRRKKRKKRVITVVILILAFLAVLYFYGLKGRLGMLRTDALRPDTAAASVCELSSAESPAAAQNADGPDLFLPDPPRGS